MKDARGLLILCALILFGAWIGLFLLKWPGGSHEKGITTDTSAGEVVINFPEAADEMPATWDVVFPALVSTCSGTHDFQSSFIFGSSPAFRFNFVSSWTRIEPGSCNAIALAQSISGL